MSNTDFNRTLIRAHPETGRFVFHSRRYNGSVGEKASDIFSLCSFFVLHCVCSVIGVRDGLITFFLIIYVQVEQIVNNKKT